ncbi:unnamed protein product [Peronospora destructor]|uniref:Uncharacterized protein n=1 Tax=Peronospora destructor TaxID=86335 RepID=A0AAV0V1U8_9STRA|nr:unnamed protein product [Peronospora destructor]
MTRSSTKPTTGPKISVAEIFGKAAGDIKASRIIDHGDNIYGNGAGPPDNDFRMEATFESVYDQPGLEGVPRINVVGNYDVGGSEYICGDKDYNFREFESTEELLKYLNLKLSLQTEVQERQQRPLETVEPLLRGKRRGEWLSVDIFNIDFNHDIATGARTSARTMVVVGSSPRRQACLLRLPRSMLSTRGLLL